MFELYGFRPVWPLLAGWEVVEALERCPSGTVSVGNGLYTARLECRDGTICVAGACFERPEGVKPDAMYYVEGGLLRPVEVRAPDAYMRLRVPAPRVHATLEINGIHMHRVGGPTPWEDTLAKVRAARVRRGDVVLDTCTGLGYTAIASLLRGARLVWSFEIDERVLWCAERNPHSSLLEADEVILVHGDVTRGVERLPDEYFTVVIHDPPRLTGATGDLYSLEFYRQLYRVLKPGGRLFHYTGRPHGGRILQGVARRLREAGFERVRWVEEAQGFTAIKPRRV